MSCVRPWFSSNVTDAYGKPFPLSCGVCPDCRRRKISLLEQRANYELGRNFRSSYITLTYDDYHLRFSNDSSSLLGTLYKRDFQSYIDRLHKKLGYKFSWLGCGEYGSQSARPHYHLCLMGVPISEQKTLRSLWKFGMVDVKPVEKGCIRYVIKYLSKSVNGILKFTRYKANGVEPPFVSWSKGFGVGLYQENFSDVSKFGYIKNGIKNVPVPAYYRNRFFDYSSDNLADFDFHNWQSRKDKFFTYSNVVGGSSLGRFERLNSLKNAKTALEKDISNKISVDLDLLQYINKELNCMT